MVFIVNFYIAYLLMINNLAMSSEGLYTVKFVIECFENFNPIKSCSLQKGYKNCNVQLQLCVGPSLQDCQYLNRFYTLPNIKGLCRKGKIDNRSKLLKAVNTFTTSESSVNFFAVVQMAPKEEKSLQGNEKHNGTIKMEVRTRVFQLSLYDTKSHGKFRINLKSKITYLDKICKNFCASYEYCNSNQLPACLNDWLEHYCSKSHTKDKDNEECSQNLKLCLRHSQSTHSLSEKRWGETMFLCNKSHSESQKQSFTNMIDNKMILYFTIGGLLLIIVILFVGISLIWKWKSQRKGNKTKELKEDRNALEMRSPLANGNIEDQTYAYIDGNDSISI